jgi:cytochrome c553
MKPSDPINKTSRQPGIGSPPGLGFLPLNKAHQPSFERKTFMKKMIIACAVLALATLTVSAADAKDNWEKICGKCHGPDGKGKTKMGEKLGIKDLTDAKLQAELKDDQAFKAVKEGIKDSEGKIKMKPAENLTDDEIKALVGLVRTLK